MDKDTSTEQLINVIQQLNEDSDVHGILLQHPVPSQMDERAAFESIGIDKDVDVTIAMLLKHTVDSAERSLRS